MKITAFQSLQPLFTEDDEKLQELRNEMFVVGDPKLVALSKHPVFPDRADYWPTGFFRSTGEVMTKDLGPAADYAAFKDALATKFAGRSTGEIFADPQPAPFFELIYFQEAGAHYMIGPKTSEKLARDFADHNNQAEQIGGPFYARYAAFKQAFEMASRSGAVKFH